MGDSMSKWINWTGGKCPVPLDTVVDIRTRTQHGGCTGPAGLFCWKIKEYMMPHDIIAYRIVDDKD